MKRDERVRSCKRCEPSFFAQPRSRRLVRTCQTARPAECSDCTYVAVSAAGERTPIIDSNPAFRDGAPRCLRVDLQVHLQLPKTARRACAYPGQSLLTVVVEHDERVWRLFVAYGAKPLCRAANETVRALLQGHRTQAEDTHTGIDSHSARVRCPARTTSAPAGTEWGPASRRQSWWLIVEREDFADLGLVRTRIGAGSRATNSGDWRSRRWTFGVLNGRSTLATAYRRALNPRLVSRRRAS